MTHLEKWDTSKAIHLFLFFSEPLIPVHCPFRWCQFGKALDEDG